MKQLQEQILQPDKVVLSKQNEAKKEVKFLGRLKIHRGQKLFEMDLTTFEVVPVAFKETAMNLDGSTNTRFVIKDKCWYAVAVNKKNAQRKFLNMARGL